VGSGILFRLRVLGDSTPSLWCFGRRLLLRLFSSFLVQQAGSCGAALVLSPHLLVSLLLVWPQRHGRCVDAVVLYDMFTPFHPSMALEGKELLAAVKDLVKQDQSKSAIAKACGYSRVVKDGYRAGTEIPDVQAFSAALLEAQGFTFGGSGRTYSPRGVVTKTKAGLLIVGGSYHGDAKPGTEYRVINEDGGVIVLEPITANGNGVAAAQQAVAA
jgi:hypothetical protein